MSNLTKLIVVSKICWFVILYYVYYVVNTFVCMQIVLKYPINCTFMTVVYTYQDTWVKYTGKPHYELFPQWRGISPLNFQIKSYWKIALICIILSNNYKETWRCQMLQATEIRSFSVACIWHLPMISVVIIGQYSPYKLYAPILALLN